MNMEQEIIKAATGIATTAVNKGVGKLTDLFFSKKILQQKRLETLSTTQDQKDAELIQQGLAEFRDERFILIEEQIGNPTSPLGLILAQNNQNQSENLGECLSKAYEHLSEKADEEISDEQISETFFNKWMNYGKEVSEDELQDLWGNILSEEISQPNSINYLVLNTFSMMNKNHLLNFTNLSKYIIHEKLFVVDGQTLKSSINFPDITENDLEELVDFGLIESLHNMNGMSAPSNPIIINGRNCQWYRRSVNQPFLICFKSSKEFNLQLFKLTSVGYKLLKIAEKNMSIETIYSDFFKYLLSLEQFKSIENIELYKIQSNSLELQLSINRDEKTSP
ncbi:hypothetical protein AY606_10610 [Acinetobacter sp. SFB]|uniref:DUF2806 domain-containing protein n=1 Tax=Acinetobacter sp. SFB TaxID=1805634 RepID=UPI0007D7CE3F|nr:DUF2806 domain-containing protein [Acinetobacter sp. SFB]OAL77887.1 hypothetical protein AY606_10610 [Acinetobacter sp. SFB]